MMSVPIGVGAVVSVPSRAAVPGSPSPGLHPLAVYHLHNCLSMPPINFSPRLHAPMNMLVDDARNEAVQLTLDLEARYLLFIDDDVLVPPHTFKQLVYRMENNPQVDVCGGVYGHKARPSFPLIFRGNGKGSYWQWRFGEFIQVTGLGMGMTIIRAKLLRRMEPPWFKTERRVNMTDTGVERFGRTEDLYFCGRAIEEYDAQIWADCSLIAGHINHETGEVFELPPDSYPFQAVRPKKKLRILDLGCGNIHMVFAGEGAAIRVDCREEVQPDYRCDIRQLPFCDGYADVVYSRHALEHFGRWEVEDVLAEWLRVLKPRGELRLIVPNVKWAAEHLEEPGAWDTLYGAQSYDEDRHAMGFTPELVREMLERRKVKVLRMDCDGPHIMVIARKARKRRGRAA